ncbi:MAG: hypothetical protein AAFZ01_02085 [Pseudomonadota bacterium]
MTHRAAHTAQQVATAERADDRRTLWVLTASLGLMIISASATLAFIQA